MKATKNSDPKKKKGHLVCPNCGKETFLIMHYGKAEYWCRKCRNYFQVEIQKEDS